MKRSRTCQCLVELDSPKRTRSTPDLAALRRKHHIFERERTLDDSMMTASVGLDGPLHILWRASSPVATTTAAAEASAIAAATAPVVGSSEAFVVDSIVRRGSLNEITILEHEQFIENVAGGRAASGLLFGPGGGASPAALLLDDDSGGDSSDYFCGVASSDEAEEDSRCGGTTTTATTSTTTATISIVNANKIGSSSSGSGFDAPCIITPNMSDAESAGQVSDASSHAAVKDHVGDDDDTVGVRATEGAVSPPLAAPAVPPSSWEKPRNYGFAASFPPTRFASGSGNAWRQQQQPPCSSVTVRVTSSLGVAGDLGGVCSPFPEKGQEEEKDRQQHATSQTVSPPWPYLVSAGAWRGAPASAPAAFYGDSLAAAAAAAAAATGGVYVVPESHTMRSQQYHRSNDGGGSIFSPGEEVKLLGGFDRLRLVDHAKQPPVVGMGGGLDPVWTCRGRESSSLGVGMEMEAESALQG